jgi:hypothetical protein
MIEMDGRWLWGGESIVNLPGVKLKSAAITNSSGGLSSLSTHGLGLSSHGLTGGLSSHGLNTTNHGNNNNSNNNLNATL